MNTVIIYVYFVYSPLMVKLNNVNTIYRLEQFR